MMQEAGTWTGRWIGRQQRVIRRLSERTPLRVKLITAVLALVTIALGAIGVASVYVLHSYLTTQSDNELRGEFGSLMINPGNLVTQPPGYLYQVYGQQNLFAGIQLPGSQLAWSPRAMPEIGRA